MWHIYLCHIYMNFYIYIYKLPWWLSGKKKNPYAYAGDAETWVLSLGQEDPLVKKMTSHSSTLARKIPWTEEPGGLQFVRVRHDWAHTHIYTHNGILLSYKKNEMPFAATWMGLEIIILSEVSQKKDKYDVILLVWGI